MSSSSPTLEKLYEDFEIEVNECACDALEVRVLNSPIDRPRAPFRVPCSPADFKDLMEELDRLVPSFDPDGTEGRELLSREIGELLFERLFPPPILRTLTGVRQSLLERGRQGGPSTLRLRLSFHHARESKPTIAGLPWELLRDPQEGFLLSTGNFTIERYQDAPHPFNNDRKAEPPLKILGLFPQPKGIHGTEGEVACNTLTETFRANKDVRFRPLEREPSKSTLRSLADLLEEQRCHVLHFYGHGGFSHGEGFLSFEDEEGKERRVTGPELARFLSSAPWLRLVVLVGCRTGRTNEGLDPASGVASSLVASGFPAVVAMRHPITIDQAQVFSEVFYNSLAENRPINLATRKARMMMQAEDPKIHPLEWATPVVTLRSHDPQIWDLRDRLGNRQIHAGIMSRKDIRQDFFRSFEVESLDLTGFFEKRRFRCEEHTWKELATVLDDWLRQFDEPGTRLLLSLACHLTIAYLVGSILSVERSIPISVVQPGRSGDASWAPDGDPGPEVPGWGGPDEKVLSADRPDLAVAVGISSPTSDAVESFIERSGPGTEQVGTLWNIEPEHGPGHHSVRNGPHAARLAEELVGRIAGWQTRHPGATVHLFLNTPAAFALFFGQVAKKLARVQLYEFYKEKGDDNYEPSVFVDSEANLRG